MTPTTFRFRLEVLGLSVRQFANLCGTNYEAASAWGSILPGGQPFPLWVGLLISAWERGGVPKPEIVGRS
jgi:hypothetical protein